MHAQVVPKEANDMMDVGRLQKFEGKITAQGNLLLHGPLLCTEGINNAERNSSVAIKPRELQVFLFQQSIIFSEIVGKKTQFVNPSYIYKNHIQVNTNQSCGCFCILSSFDATLGFINCIFHNDFSFFYFFFHSHFSLTKWQSLRNCRKIDSCYAQRIHNVKRFVTSSPHNRLNNVMNGWTR